MDLERAFHRPTTDSGLSVDAVVHAGGPARLTVRGELDEISADDLTGAVRALLSGVPAPAALELDMAGVTFIDSAGIRCLLACHRLATEAGGTLVLARPSARVVEVLEITGLSAHFGLPAVTSGAGSADVLFARSSTLREHARQTCARARELRGLPRGGRWDAD